MQNILPKGDRGRAALPFPADSCKKKKNTIQTTGHDGEEVSRVQ